MRKLDLRRLITRRCKKNEREAPFGVVLPRQLLEAERVAKEPERGIHVRHAQHRVQVLHGRQNISAGPGASISTSWREAMKSPVIICA